MKPRKPLPKVSKTPHKRLSRFVPAVELAKVKARSGGICECFVVKGDFKDVGPFKTLEDAEKYGRYLATLQASTFGYAMVRVERCHRVAAKQPHHVLARSQGGTHTADNLKDVCYFPHHDWIENHKTEAAKRGLYKPFANYTP